jgi:urocanate hydratase
MTSGPRPVRAARGTTLTTKGWQQEAALANAAEQP